VSPRTILQNGLARGGGLLAAILKMQLEGRALALAPLALALLFQ